MLLTYLARKQKAQWNYLKTFNPRDICRISQSDVKVESVITNKLQRNAWTTAKPMPLKYLVS